VKKENGLRSRKGPPTVKKSASFRWEKKKKGGEGKKRHSGEVRPPVWGGKKRFHLPEGKKKGGRPRVRKKKVKKRREAQAWR